MVGKNNFEVKQEKSTEKVHKYSIRKFKNGIASAAIGALLIGASGNVDTVSAQVEENGTDAEVTEEVATPEVETPAAETPEVVTPAVVTPAVETPAAETPAVETPAAETPAVETPAAETPAAETPAAETPAAETPEVVTPAAETPAAETPEVETQEVEAARRRESREVREAKAKISALIDEVRRADLDEEDYTEESWAALVEAYRAAENVRDSRRATVESITKDLNDLRYAFNNLVEREVVESYPFGIEVRGLDGRRTDDVRIEVTNEDGESIAGSFDQYGRWASDEELPVGRYRISLRTPKGTYAILNDTVQQGTEASRRNNTFFIDVNADNLFGNSRVYAGLQLRLVREVRHVIEAIDGLTFDEWYRGFPGDVAEARAAYDTLDGDLQALVTNYGALEVAEARVAINTVIREVRRADLDEDDYTEESWAQLVDALKWAEISRDNPRSTVESITKDLNDLRYAFDNLMTKKQKAWNDLLDRIEDLENQLDELKEENADLKDELDQLRDELDELRENQEGLEDRIKELEDRVDELEDRVEDLEARPTPETPTDEEPADDDEDEDDDDDVVDEEDNEDDDDDVAGDVDEDDDRPAPAKPKPADVVVKAADDDVVILPSTGVAPSSIGVGIATLLSGLGLGFIGKKRKEDE